MSVPSPQPVVPQDFEPFSRWLTRTFQFFGANAGVWLLQGLIYLGASLVLIGGPILLFVFSMPGLIMLFRHDRSPSWPEIAPYFGFIIIGVLVISIVYAFVYAYFSSGMFHTALKQLRGEPIAVNDVFNANFAVLPVFGACLLISIVLFIATILCFFPILFVAPLFTFCIPIIVDRRVGAMDAISQSINVVKQNYWLFFVYMLVIGAIYFTANTILSFITGASLLVSIITLPLKALFATVPYIDIFYGQSVNGSFQPSAGPQAYMPPPYTPPTNETSSHIPPPPPSA